jgi:galactofuranose transport system permease protein
LGMFIEAIGINPSSSFHSGINEKNIKLLVYVLCGLCAGVAGLIISSNIKSADANNAGMLYELDAILSVVIGGTSLTGGRFSLIGSLLGALIVQSLITTIYSVGVPPEVTMVVKAIVVLLVSLVQSEHFRKAVLGRLATRREVAR